MNKKDNTRNQRQARRREREKRWLIANGWRSWEALHTALMDGAVFFASGEVDASDALNEDIGLRFGSGTSIADVDLGDAR